MVESVELAFSNRIIKNAIYVFVYCFVLKLEVVDWRIPYIGFMLVGAIISYIKFNKKINDIAILIIFVLGIYISATGDYVGMYKPLAYLERYLGFNLRVLGVTLLIISISNSDTLKRIFDTKIGRWLSKYSMAIYVIHWGIIISVSCGITYHLKVLSGLPYMLAGTIGIVIGLLVTIILAALFTEDFYNPYCRIVLKRIEGLIKNIGEYSDERKSTVCNSISKMP